MLSTYFNPNHNLSKPNQVMTVVIITIATKELIFVFIIVSLTAAGVTAIVGALFLETLLQVISEGWGNKRSHVVVQDGGQVCSKYSFHAGHCISFYKAD